MGAGQGAMERKCMAVLPARSRVTAGSCLRGAAVDRVGLSPTIFLSTPDCVHCALVHTLR